MRPRESKGADTGEPWRGDESVTVRHVQFQRLYVVTYMGRKSKKEGLYVLIYVQLIHFAVQWKPTSVVQQLSIKINLKIKLPFSMK